MNKLKPDFRQCLEEGRAESLMSAYNSANGEWCGQNGELLNGVVRDIWGYDDVVITSDWVFGMRDAAKSVKAGLDIEMPFRSIRYKHLFKALRSGKASWDDIERLGKQILRFELKYYSRIAHLPSLDAGQVVESRQHRDLAKVSASKGMVLLKKTTIPFYHWVRTSSDYWSLVPWPHPFRRAIWDLQQFGIQMSPVHSKD